MLKNAKAIAVVSTALFVGSLVWLMNAKSVNGSLEAGLQKEKLKSEALLSEKLLLEKEMTKLKDQLFSLKESNLDLENVVKSTSDKLRSQEAEYNRMKRENTSLGQIRKQREELQALRHQLENELQSLRLSYSELEARNEELNRTVSVLEQRNRVLTDDLNRAMFASIDQSQIQAVKGKTDKLTVRAKRTKKLIAGFEVPGNLKNLSFRIKDSKGKVLSTEAGSIAVTVEPSDNNYLASTDSEVQGNRLQKVRMTYTPKQKLQSGVYTVEILNDDLYVGSLRVKLN